MVNTLETQVSVHMCVCAALTALSVLVSPAGELSLEN